MVIVYILDNIINTCSDPGLANILWIVKNAFNLIQIIGPIIAMVSLVIILLKLFANPENKKLKNALRNWLIALLLLFFIPVIIDATMRLLDDSFSISSCWNNAVKSDNSTNSDYINSSNKKPTNGFIDPALDHGSTAADSSSTSNNRSSSSSNTSKRIYVGDSRTVQMKYYIVGDNWSCSGNGTDWSIHGSDVWSCKGSMGLDWMKSTGIPNIESQISSGSALIILMGVNDLHNYQSYINYINGKVSSWVSKGAKVYFVSVMPTSGGYDNLNSSIDTFNSKLKSGLSSNITYIDTNNYMKKNGFTATDGLHYDSATSKKIYGYINSHL